MIKEIEQLIETLDKDKVLDYKTRRRMTTSLNRFLDKAILKFIKGQKEHGGDIRDKNLDEEIFNEQIDQFWYAEARNWLE